MFDHKFSDLHIAVTMVVHVNLFVLEQMAYLGIVFLIAQQSGQVPSGVLSAVSFFGFLKKCTMFSMRFIFLVLKSP